MPLERLINPSNLEDRKFLFRGFPAFSAREIRLDEHFPQREKIFLGGKTHSICKEPYTMDNGVQLRKYAQKIREGSTEG